MIDPNSISKSPRKADKSIICMNGVNYKGEVLNAGNSMREPYAFGKRIGFWRIKELKK